MGNLITKRTTDLQLKINATKQDISRDYDLFTIEGVTKANEELIKSFYDFSNKDTIICTNKTIIQRLKCLKVLALLNIFTLINCNYKVLLITVDTSIMSHRSSPNKSFGGISLQNTTTLGG